MSRLTVRLPESLHRQLHQRAHQEGVSLNQYVVFALTRQATIAYVVEAVPGDAVARQQTNFEEMLQRLGTATPDQVQDALAERESVAAEPALTPEVTRKLQERVVRQQH